MSDICLTIGGISLLALPVVLVILIIQAIRRKPKKKWAITLLILAISFVVFETIGVETICDHDWILTNHAEPTCTEKGSNQYKCSLCDKTKSESIPASGHNFKLLSTTESTCTEEGKSISRCTVCDIEQTEVIPVKDHNFEIINTINPTCTEEGKSISRCTICNTEQSESIPALGHDLQLIGTTEPAIESDGTEKFKCSRCDYEESKTIDKLKCSHSWVKATCIEPKHCEICGETKGKVSNNHQWKEATCAEPQTCLLCGKTKGKTVDHTWTEATLVTPKTCSVCGATDGMPLLTKADLYGTWAGPTKDGDYTGYLYFADNGIFFKAGQEQPSIYIFTSDYRMTKEYDFELEGTSLVCKFNKEHNNDDCKLTFEEKNSELIIKTTGINRFEGTYTKVPDNTTPLPKEIYYGNDVPYYGMPEYNINNTGLGKYDKIELCKDYYKLRKDHQLATYYWYDNDGKEIFSADTLNGKVIGTVDWRNGFKTSHGP